MIIYGRNVVWEALINGFHISRAYMLDSKNLSVDMKRTEEALRAANVPIEKLDEKRLDDVTHSKEHQGIAAKIKDYKYADTFGVLDDLDHEPFVVILDQVQDPHNLGAIIRSAYGAGVDLIIIQERGGCGVTPAVLKTSAGYAFRMPVSVENNVGRVLDELKKRGIWTYAAVMDGTPYTKVNFKGPVALVFGNEGRGIRRLVVEKCDEKITIPMARKMDSLNVSVSAAVISFHVMGVKTR